MRAYAILLALGFVFTGCQTSTTSNGSTDSNGAPYQKVNVTAFKELVAGKGVVLDVRTAQEFQEGHLQGAQNIDVLEPDFESKIKQLDPNETYYVYCKMGGRSAKASDLMVKANFKKVYDLEGGISAWEAAGNAVVQ